jgi:hypothetical protein
LVLDDVADLLLAQLLHQFHSRSVAKTAAATMR